MLSHFCSRSRSNLFTSCCTLSSLLAFVFGCGKWMLCYPIDITWKVETFVKRSLFWFDILRWVHVHALCTCCIVNSALADLVRVQCIFFTFFCSGRRMIHFFYKTCGGWIWKLKRNETKQKRNTFPIDNSLRKKNPKPDEGSVLLIYFFRRFHLIIFKYGICFINQTNANIQVHMLCLFFEFSILINVLPHSMFWITI